MSEDITIEKNYPIVEALAEFRFAQIELTEDRVEQLYDLFKDRYPVRRELKMLRHEIEVSSLGQMQSSVEIPRYQFLSKDSFSLVQIDQGLFTLNRLKPYYKWTQFKADIQDTAARFTGIQEIVLKEVVLQYINRIPVKEGDDLEHIMRFRPLFDGQFSDCNAMVIIPCPDLNGFLQKQMQTLRDPDQSIAILLTLYAQMQSNSIAEAVAKLEVAHKLLNDQYELCVYRDVVEACVNG